MTTIDVDNPGSSENPLAAALLDVTKVYSTNRSVLAETDATSREASTLLESGREGLFVWDDSNVSSNVAADTKQGMFLPPTNATGSGGAWARPKQHFVDSAWFGAQGDGSSDATAAIQAAIDYSKETGEELRIRPGKFVTTSTLTGNKGVRITGAGWSGDRGWGYNGGGVWDTSIGDRGTMFIVPSTGQTCMSFTTNDAVILRDFGIIFPNNAVSSVRGIKITPTTTGSGQANVQSIIDSVLVMKAGIALEMNDCLSFNVSNSRFLYNTIGGARFDNPNWPSYQIAFFDKNEIWGGTGYLFEMKAGGEIHVTNNKFNAGAASSVAIGFTGATSGSSNMEPMFVIGNSMEGQNIGILFNTANATQSSTQIVIASNQIWAVTAAIQINEGVNSGYPWVIGATITGNMLVIAGGTGVGPIFPIAGLSEALISGNVFSLTSGTGTAIAFGNNNVRSEIKIAGNRYVTGVTRPTFTTPSVPSSTVAQANESSYQIQVHVNGGTVSAIAVNGVTCATSTNRSVTLDPGDEITLTYSGAPTWVWHVINP